jgi:ASCH domain
MKVLTVRQPWASLIVTGIKDVENRSWRTNYRGHLGVHAAGRIDKDGLEEWGHLVDDEPPIGALIGSVTLVDCIENSRSKWAVPGAWHWVLADPRELARPRPMLGRLGLWET